MPLFYHYDPFGILITFSDICKNKIQKVIIFSKGVYVSMIADLREADQM